MVDPTPMHTNQLLSAALAYASIGWNVLPAWWAVKKPDGSYACSCGNPQCKSPAKHPIAAAAPWGQNSATTDANRIKSWWGTFPDANIAIYLEPSNLVAVDIDPRNDGLQTIDDIEAKHGPLISDILQFTGGGGEHRVFSRPANTTMPGKLGPGVDVKANGYIIAEPSNHISGGSYQWEASSDPREGIMASPLPDWMRDLAAPKLPGVPNQENARVMPIGEDTKQELIEALRAIPADDRDTWLRVGMALNSIGDPNWAFGLWDAWSQQSRKYDHVDQIRVWRSFKPQGLDGITYKTIFAMAKERGVVVIPLMSAGSPVEPPIDIDDVIIRQAEEAFPIDPRLLTPPGVMRDIVDWINHTSRKPQPQFAVQAAIAFCSTVIGRRFKTDYGNWSPLYLLNVGLSASGKEYAKEAIETLLDACGLSGLIGPSGYSSDSGVVTALLTKPNHIAIIDEFHRVLEQATVKSGSRLLGMLRTMMEVWGRTNGVLRSVGFSNVGSTPSQAKALQDRDVSNPSVTVMAMTIPSFWESVGSTAAKDGFLNRFLIVETTIGRQVGQFVPTQPVPQSVIDWATQIRARYTGIIDTDTNPMGVTPVMVGIDNAAMKLFNDFSAECIELMDKYEKDGLAEMFGRSNEIAMKLALTLALGRMASTVSVADAEWAILYVKTYALRAVHRLQECMADGDFEQAKNQVLQVLLKCGDRGATVRELGQRSRRFKGMTQRQQLELLNSMAFLGDIAQVNLDSISGRGRPRSAWVAVHHVGE